MTIAALVLALASLLLAWSAPAGVAWDGQVWAWAPALAALALAALAALRRRRDSAQGLLLTLAAAAGALATLDLAGVSRETGAAFAPGVWLFVGAVSLLSWLAMEAFAAAAESRPRAGWAVPALFGAGLLYGWEVLVTGFQIPQILLPAPSQIWGVIATSLPMLWADFRQTFLKAVIAGYAMGCAAGFVVAVLVDRVPFLQRGLLPLGALVSALPIVGIAPIMVMWFGFDWQSKAAVVVVMTFFPMLVNANAGLAASGRMERDLMRTYAASYAHTLLKLRLPAALPFLFNALKINSTLALIGAIVAEFFGTPIVGMGFRISVEVGRLNIPSVWATIAVAALAGSSFYGALALVERATTSWHPSYRR